MKKKIYISLPITGYMLQERIARANYLKSLIIALGHEPIAPFDLEGDMPTEFSSWSDEEKYAYYMGIDIRALLLCDGAYFDNDWKKSKGCRCENATAKIYNIEQFYLLSDIPQAK